jgi:hypothetical protein
MESQAPGTVISSKTEEKGIKAIAAKDDITAIKIKSGRMLIAKKKRKENIAEYILYMWQIEDLLRALNFDRDLIFRTLVDPLDLPDDKKQEVLYWYLGIIDLLKEEKKEVAGHNYHSLHVINELNNLHLSLLEKDSKYNSLFDAAKDDIELFKEKSSK